MEWWAWLILVVVVLALLGTLAVVLQRRRRTGRVIGLGDSARQRGRRGS